MDFWHPLFIRNPGVGAILPKKCTTFHRGPQTLTKVSRISKIWLFEVCKAFFWLMWLFHPQNLNILGLYMLQDSYDCSNIDLQTGSKAWFSEHGMYNWFNCHFFAPKATTSIYLQFLYSFFANYFLLSGCYVHATIQSFQQTIGSYQ